MGKTRGVHETTPELRNRMVGMYEAGLGLREIAAAVNCSQRTVKRWLNRFDKEGTVETRERCGRKRATTSEQDEAIIRLASQTPITAAKAVLPALGLSCSVDTVRERLHKAGIHNWSPSRKHIQRIRLSNVGDSTGIQQSVWRPTGTQLGKKKAFKETITGKDGIPVGKKKTSPRKAKNKNAYISDSAPVEVLQQSESVFSTQQNLQESQSVQQSQNTDLQTSSQSVPVSQTQFNNTVTLAQQPIYHHHGLNVAQNWPLDLVQDSHHYMQGQSNPIPHEHPPLQRQLQELHTQQEQLEQQMQVQARLQDVHHQNADRVHHCQDPQAQFSQRLSESQHHQQTHQLETREPSAIELPSNEADTMILRIDSCSNSSNSNDNSQISNVEEEPGKDTTRRESERQKQRRQKKGGKAKGTLETSVELRNRMIGMSEAGLSTLSIALAINRSERTVKRWLERWHKEGNVKTKERKGRRRITTKEQDEAIIAMATAHPLTAAKYVAPALGLRCSVDTVRERLHKAGIHSWKLGKKQGEGNAVHTVHLWQPSGNRPNILRRPGEKRKKCVGDQRLRHSTGDVSKRSPRKKKNDASQLKPVPPPANIALEQNTAQFHNPGCGNIMQTTHNIPVQQPPSHTQRSLLPSSLNLQDPPGPQSMQTLVPVVQQRPDCRLAPPIGPPVSAQRGTVAYSPCMVGNNSHTTHIDPPDSLNYEPYMWNF